MCIRDRPYQDHLSALIHEPTFRNAVGPAVFNKAKIIKDLGNQAVHTTKPVRQFDALTAVRELFHVTFWLARTYARQPEGDVKQLADRRQRVELPDRLRRVDRLVAQVFDDLGFVEDRGTNGVAEGGLVNQRAEVILVG